MPSTKKRINLTVSPEVYELLQEFKAANGITNDASACMQIITKQLNKMGKNSINKNYIKQNPAAREILHMSTEGFQFFKDDDK